MVYQVIVTSQLNYSCKCIFSLTLWSSLTGVNIEANPCRVRDDDAMLFYGLSSREAVTVPLNLTDVRYTLKIIHADD